MTQHFRHFEQKKSITQETPEQIHDSHVDTLDRAAEEVSVLKT